MLRKLLIKYVTPRLWRASNWRLANAMRMFSEVEADSGWQALQIAYTTNSSELHAQLLSMAIEEAAHARHFRRLSDKINDERPKIIPVVSRKAIISNHGDVAAALAEVSLNEQEIFREFELYASASGRPDVAAVFARIAQDEQSHADDTGDLICDLMGGDEEKTAVLFRSARRRRRFRLLTTVSEKIGNFFFFIWSTLIYLFFGFPTAVLLGFSRAIRNPMRNNLS